MYFTPVSYVGMYIEALHWKQTELYQCSLAHLPFD